MRIASASAFASVKRTSFARSARLISTCVCASVFNRKASASACASVSWISFIRSAIATSSRCKRNASASVLRAWRSIAFSCSSAMRSASVCVCCNAMVALASVRCNAIAASRSACKRASWACFNASASPTSCSCFTRRRSTILACSRAALSRSICFRSNSWRCIASVSCCSKVASSISRSRSSRSDASFFSVAAPIAASSRCRP